MRINLPNQITLLRLALALAFFFVLGFFSADRLAETSWLLVVGFWLFLVAVVTDIIDGALARALKQVTSFGRIIDPIVDKVIICGAFVIFAGSGFYSPEEGGSLVHVAPWMAILILTRELAVSAIRAYAESQGVDFSADWAGKIKMLVQSVTVCFILGSYGYEQFHQLQPIAHLLVWVTVVVTAASIVTYVRRGWQYLFSPAAMSGQSGQNAPKGGRAAQPGAPTPPAKDAR